MHPDLWIIGNVATRGMPVIEKIISEKKNYMSGPEFLSQKILKGRRVIAVAGTHGKTTVSSIITWLLECAGLKPGFLIGGIPINFGISARVGKSNSPFVIEADEYDTPFFDKIIIEKLINKTSSKKEKIFLIKEKKQRHNIFGTWSTNLEKILEEDLNNNFRKVDLWADKIGCSFIEKDIRNENEFLNINTKEDLEVAERIYNKK